MSVTTGIAVFFLIWWVALFAVLPWGVRSQEESGDVARGSDPGAPSLPRLGAKLLWTTVVAALIFAAFLAIVQTKLVTLDDLLKILPMPQSG